MAPESPYSRSVFLNCPYDAEFQDQFLAYVVAICSFGFLPRTTLEIEGGEQRLRRIAQLIQNCHLSFHDLSRVELTAGLPRFNMPFEAGLAVMSSLTAQEHKYFIFEKSARRIQKSLSDLDGSDVYAHEGSVEGVLARVGDALLKAKRRPSIGHLLQQFRLVRSCVPNLMEHAGARSLFSPRVCRDLIVLATAVAEPS